jgi:hypothetical protein
MNAAMKISVKNPLGSWKIKGPTDAVKEMAGNLQDVMPKMPDLPDDSLPRVLRTNRQLPSIAKPFRYRGAGER